MSREALRVYAGCSLGTGPTRPSRYFDGQVVEPTAAKRIAPVPIATIVEQELSRIVDSQPLHGESVQGAFDRKERELRALFTSLTQAEAAELLERVSSANGASSLSRINTDRRNRLVTFLTATAKGRMVQQ